MGRLARNRAHEQAFYGRRNRPLETHRGTQPDKPTGKRARSVWDGSGDALGHTGKRETSPKTPAPTGAPNSRSKRANRVLTHRLQSAMLGM